MKLKGICRSLMIIEDEIRTLYSNFNEKKQQFIRKRLREHTNDVIINDDEPYKKVYETRIKPNKSDIKRVKIEIHPIDYERKMLLANFMMKDVYLLWKSKMSRLSPEYWKNEVVKSEINQSECEFKQSIINDMQTRREIMSDVMIVLSV